MRVELNSYSGVDLRSTSAHVDTSNHPKEISATGDQVDFASPAQIQQAEGDLRLDRVAEVRDRIASGFYNQSAVREQIASAFLDAQRVGSF